MCPAYLLAGSSCLTLVRDLSGQGSPTPLGVQTPLDVGGTARVAPVRDPGGHGPSFPSPRGNAVLPPGPGARARVSPGGRAGHLVQQPKASARAARPARRDRIPTRAGRAEPRGSLCRRWQRSREWLTRSAIQVRPGPEPRPGLPLFGRCPRARRPTVGRPFRAGHRRSLPTPLVGVRSPVRATSGHPGRSCPGLRGTLAWIVWAPRGIDSILPSEY